MRKITRRDFLRGSAAFFAGSVVLGGLSKSTIRTNAEEASGEGVSEVLEIWKNPSSNVDAKPMTRFWFPDAGAGLTDEDYETYKEELSTGDGANLYNSDYLQSVAQIENELYDAGFGGVEVTMLCDSASYSSTQARVVGWGTPAWCRVLAQALYTANHLGEGAFKVDLTLTSHWPLIIDNIDPNDPQQQKGLVLGTASSVDVASLEAAGSTRLALPEQDIQDGGGATFLFEDDLVEVTLVKKVNELYDLASAISLSAEGTDGYAVGVPESDLLIQYDGRWYDQEWFTENFADVDQSGLETSEVTKRDTFNIAYGLENGRNRDYLDDWQYYYEVKNQDILDAVGEDTDGDWYLIPVYSRGTGQNFSGDGNMTMPYRTYAINYYTEDGAYAVINYWEENMLDQESYVYDENGELQGPFTIRELMKESKVSAIFEDSLELNLGDTSAAWSEDMLESWTNYLGYDVSAYLPALINSGEFTNSENESFVSDLNTDYTNLKENLFNDKHCQVISEWSTAIDMTLDSDVAAGYCAYLEKYGLNATGDSYGANAGGGYRFQSGSDDFQKSLDVDIVEGDNSSFNGDAIRRMDGTVAIKDDNGYTSFEALTLTMNDTVFYGGIYELNYCFSNGINRVVLHGTPYSQPFNEASMMSMNQWPGWTFMNYGCYDARQAYFNDLYNEDGSVNENADVYNWTYYITRVQGLLQNTDEQMDFLIVSNDTDTFSRELLDQGYHYSLTSEFGILYDSAVTDPENIVDGVMSAGKHNIKAIVLKNLTEVQNPEVLDRLINYAEKGLKILCLNSDVTSVSGTEGTKDESYTDEVAAAKWEELCSYENVISITNPEEVADYVESSIRYDVRSETTGSLESGWVEAKELKDSSSDIDYYYFWNGATTCYTATESQGGFPGMEEETEPAEEKDYYGLDAFDRVYGEGGYGEMLGFEGVTQKITVTVNAAENSIPYLLDPVTGEIREIAAYTMNEDGTMTLDLEIAGFDCLILAVSASETLFDSAELLYDRTENESTDLSEASYDLTVYSYTNGHEDNKDWISDDATTVTEINMSIDGLKLWDEIAGLEEISGYAYYTTSFAYAPEDSDGAYLYYEHKANDTARCQDMITEVKVTNSNGEETVFSSIPQISERVDLGTALSEGDNTIRIKLVTTLAAAKSANGDFLCVSENQNYGLTGLKIVNYVNVAND